MLPSAVERGVRIARDQLAERAGNRHRYFQHSLKHFAPKQLLHRALGPRRIALELSRQMAQRGKPQRLALDMGLSEFLTNDRIVILPGPSLASTAFFKTVVNTWFISPG